MTETVESAPNPAVDSSDSQQADERRLLKKARRKAFRKYLKEGLFP